MAIIQSSAERAKSTLTVYEDEDMACCRRAFTKPTRPLAESNKLNAVAPFERRGVACHASTFGTVVDETLRRRLVEQREKVITGDDTAIKGLGSQATLRCSLDPELAELLKERAIRSHGQ